MSKTFYLLSRPLCFNVRALSQQEFTIIVYRFPINAFTDHNPILFLFTRKASLTQRQYKTF